MESDLPKISSMVQYIWNVNCITQVAFLKYFKFCLNDQIPDVETYAKKP